MELAMITGWATTLKEAIGIWIGMAIFQYWASTNLPVMDTGLATGLAFFTYWLGKGVANRQRLSK
jgi:hypothetical protein